MGSMPEHGSIRALDGRAIPYVLERSESQTTKAAFLLLHGLGVDKNEYLDFYRTLSSVLSRSGFDVLRIDFPSHGESKAPSSDFSLVNCIADAIVAAGFVLKKSGVGQLSVFGTSFGAGPAVVAASFYRTSLRSATLLAPAISYRDLYVFPKHPQRVSKYREFYYEALLQSKTIPVTQDVDLGWRNAIEFAIVDVEYHLAQISDRTAIIHGQADSIVPYEFSQEIARRVPEIDLTPVPGMEHGFMDKDDEDGVGELSARNLRLIFQKATR